MLNLQFKPETNNFHFFTFVLNEHFEVKIKKYYFFFTLLAQNNDSSGLSEGSLDPETEIESETESRCKLAGIGRVRQFDRKSNSDLNQTSISTKLFQ